MMFSPPKPVQPSPQAPRHGAYTKDPVGLWADVPAFTAFAQEVHEAMEGTELRYSKRQHLLKRADHYGIKRFDANLVIAMVQHRLGGMEESAPQISNRSPVMIAAMVLAVQGLIVIAGWWLIA